MNFTEEFNNLPMSSRPKIRWWLPSVYTEKNELEREILMLKDAGFSGAEVVGGFCCDPITKKQDKGWGNVRWGEQIKHILKFAEEHDFETDLMVLTSSKQMLDIFSDVDDPVQGVRMELDGEHITGITKENPYFGPIPVSGEAVRDAEAVNGTCVLFAVTIAKYADKEKSILSLESARELQMGTEVIKTGDDSLSYTVGFVPEDDGEYVLFAWWQHPSGENLNGIPQFDFLGEYGTKRFLQYHEDVFLPQLGEMKEHITSYFTDSIEWESHLDFVVGFREMFQEKFGFDITAYLPALYEKDYWGCYRNPCPDFTFDKQNEQLINCYGEFLTDLYIKNHLKPMQEFCHKHGFTFRCQSSYGKFLELEKTAGFADIPDTETLYGKDILDFYRAQSGAVHITGKSIYSIEGSAEAKGRGNGEENSGCLVQGFKRQLWHLQRAFAVGVNRVYFHGCVYRGDYSGPGNENGVLPGIHWPGNYAMGFVGGCANAWDDRQPNWHCMRQLTDCLSRIQHVLQKGKAIVDLAVYRHSYQEVLDSFHPEKLFETSVLEQLGYSYDFVSPSHLTDYDVRYDGESIFNDGPQYRALIFNEQKHLPISVLQKLIDLSKQGLPVIFCGGVPETGAFFGEMPNAAEFAELLNSENVRVCDSIEQIPDVLKNLNIRPRAAYPEKVKVLNAYRRTEDADYIYFYHYADADTHPEIQNAERISFTADLQTKGIPYILDPWTGNISEAVIVKWEKNCVSVKLDLAPNDSTIVISVSPDNARIPTNEVSSRTIQYDKSFELQNWTLTVESWTEGDVPLQIKKEIIKEAKLKEPIFFTKLEGLEAVSGVGYYCADLDMENGWEEGSGAYLLADEIEDCYKIEVNGIQIPANQVYPCTDIGRYLKKGRNRIKISVYSTLLNAAISYCREYAITDAGQYKDYGMNGPVKIIPYTR